jgi:hypothetical protein
MADAPRLGVMVPSATLRVFQPLEGFELDEQRIWERYLVERVPSVGALRRYRDQETSEGLGLLARDEGEHADVRILDGVTYLSPHRTRLRSLAALLSIREAQAIELWDAFVPRSVARRAARELRRIRRHSPRAVSFVHESPWHVPIRWFAFFRDEERRLELDDDGEPRLRYRTTLRRAIRRAENAIPILRRSDLAPIAELILDLHQWMTLFDRRSLLELDYGALARLMTWDELDDDRSARDVQEAVDALAKLEVPQAAATYQVVLERWAGVRAFEALN